MDKISGYLGSEYDQHWWLVNVPLKDNESDDVDVTFIHLSGPAPSFVLKVKINKS